MSDSKYDILVFIDQIKLNKKVYHYKTRKKPSKCILCTIFF